MTDVFRFAEDGSNRMYVHGEEVVLASSVQAIFEPRFMVLSLPATREDDWLDVPLAGYARPHDIVLNTRTGEMVVVRAVGGDVLQVKRGLNCPPQEMRAEDELLIVGAD